MNKELELLAARGCGCVNDSYGRSVKATPWMDLHQSNKEMTVCLRFVPNGDVGLSQRPRRIIWAGVVWTEAAVIIAWHAGGCRPVALEQG